MRPGPGRPAARVAVAPWWALLLCLGCGAGVDAPELDLPPRPEDAQGGAEIAGDLLDLDVEAREERIYEEVARGNVPSWLRELERVEVTGEVDGRRRTVTFWVTPDYLAVGSDTNAFLVPLSARTARRIADLAGASLPTARMVDAIWAAADIKLHPIRIRPDEHLRTMRYFRRHDRLVWAQRFLYGAPPGAFVAGHKLDLVLSVPEAGSGRSPAIYGWHQPGGAPIQPRVAVEMDRPPHFSLGVRLVARDVLVDGEKGELSEVMGDPELAGILGAGGDRGAEGDASTAAGREND